MAYAQEYTLDFTACDLSHPVGNTTTNGNPVCVCGIIDQSMSFDGIDDGLTLPDSLLKIMIEDFTIDFYLDIDNKGDEQVDIFAIGDDCGIDSLITIKYVQSSKDLLVELYVNNGLYFPLKGKLDDLCWNRITLTKLGLNYKLYINNLLKDKVAASQIIPFSKNAKVSLSNGPCLISIADRLEGKIDEFKIFDRALADRELAQSYDFPERIINNDTTIFKGSSLNLNYVNTCASDFEWLPALGLDNPTDKDVIANPETTTTYAITAIGDGCISKDKITINVIDPEKLDCEKLLLPSAFTPNGDKVNDEYKISNNFIVENLDSFEIIDRWGEVLYKTSVKTEGWDGSYLAKTAEPAIYMYRVNYTCKGQKFNTLGNFALIK
jgi:gliding motility-associated-like protein